MPPTRVVRGGVAVALGLGVASLPACGLDLAGLGSTAPVDASAGDVTLADGAGTLDGTLDQTSDGSGEGDVAPDHARDASAAADAGDATKDGAEQDVAAGDAGDASDAHVAACDASIEICDNGIDDNCDGLIDCQDPECVQQQYACSPPVPAGWQLVAYVFQSRPPCPTGWGSAADQVEGPDASTTCPCTCGTPLANACVSGTASMSLGVNVCACPNVQNVPLASDGACDPIGAPIGQPCGPWGDGLVTPIDAGTVACSATTQLPSPGYATQGETCQLEQPTGAGCPNGGGCVPVPTPAIACIEAAGVQTSCPSGYTSLHVVYEPSNVIDQRQCGSCACTSSPTACTGATVTLYDDPACTKNAVSIPADGRCDAITGNPSDAGWFVYSATPSTTACSGPASAPVDGGLLLRAPATICCP